MSWPIRRGPAARSASSPSTTPSTAPAPSARTSSTTAATSAWAARESAARADELLQQFRLADRASALAAQLSGGLAQRVQVARAIAHRPRGALPRRADRRARSAEPARALGADRGELHERASPMLLTTHYMEEADRLSDRVAIIDHGQGAGHRHAGRAQASGRGRAPWCRLQLDGDLAGAGGGARQFAGVREVLAAEEASV